MPRSLPATAACARGSGPMTASKRHLSHVAEGSEPLRGYTASAPALAPASGVSASATAAPEAGVGLRQEGRPGRDLCPFAVLTPASPAPASSPHFPPTPHLDADASPAQAGPFPGRAVLRGLGSGRSGLCPVLDQRGGACATGDARLATGRKQRRDLGAHGLRGRLKRPQTAPGRCHRVRRSGEAGLRELSEGAGDRPNGSPVVPGAPLAHSHLYHLSGQTGHPDCKSFPQQHRVMASGVTQ